MLAHLILEALAYAVGFRLYLRERKRAGDFLDDSARWSLIVAVVLGAALGSKLLHHLASPARVAAHWGEPDFLPFLLGGKTIVGALLGGWIAVEGTKRALGIRRSTGDLYALPLAIGIAVGRVGCLLAALEDGTHGVATSLPLAIDFGDGIARHPVRLYEILGLALIALVLARRPAFLAAEGARFRFFLAAYLALRISLDFLKPAERALGLSGIQWAALLGLAWLAGGALVRTTAPAHAPGEVPS